MNFRKIMVWLAPIALLVGCQPESPTASAPNTAGVADQPPPQLPMDPDPISRLAAQRRDSRLALSARERNPRDPAVTLPATSQVVVEPYHEWDLEETVIDSLGRIGQPAVPALVAMLQHPDVKRRRQAAAILGRIGPQAQEATGVLVEALKDPDPTVQKAAARALGQIGPSAADAVGPLLDLLEQARANEP